MLSPANQGLHTFTKVYTQARDRIPDAVFEYVTLVVSPSTQNYHSLYSDSIQVLSNFSRIAEYIGVGRCDWNMTQTIPTRGEGCPSG